MVVNFKKLNGKFVMHDSLWQGSVIHFVEVGSGPGVGWVVMAIICMLTL